MNKKLNAILGKFFGIKVVRIVKPTEHHNPESLIIEFLGISGVGKTTLCNYFLKNHTINFQRELITQKDLRALRQKFHVKLDDFCDFLLNKKIEEVAKKDINGSKKHHTIAAKHKKLSDVCLVNSHLANKVIISDDFLFKSFGHYIIRTMERKELKKVLENRILVFCTASVDTIFNHAKKRGRNKENQNDREFKKEIEHRLNRDKKMCTYLKKNGAAILEVNTANELSHNSGLIDSFIGDYLKKEVLIQQVW